MSSQWNTDMETLFQSVALVKQLEGEQFLYLVKWHAATKCWRLIVAERLNKESFRESILREVGWQLDLQRQSDYLVSHMAQLCVEFMEPLPDNYERHVALAFYNVHIYNSAVLHKIEQDRSNRWVTAAELCQGKTSDGQTIDPRVVRWINNWEVVQPWQ